MSWDRVVLLKDSSILLNLFVVLTTNSCVALALYVIQIRVIRKVPTVFVVVVVVVACHYNHLAGEKDKQP